MSSPPPRIWHLDSETRAPLHARSGVSLHAHTFYSQETLGFIPSCAAAVPIVSSLFRAEVRRYLARGGAPIDFCSGYWRPPLPPADVLASERAQIEDTLGLNAIVSVTDHDSIKAGLMLSRSGADVPVSLEWTVPFRAAFLHLGLHNLPMARANGIMRQLIAYTAHPDESRLGGLLEWLGESPETLVVLNHPFWDLEGIGAAAHQDLLLAFLQSHQSRLHALELNGMQTWENNQKTLALAQAIGQPVVSGGDRHGCAPNAMVNLTRVRTFAEFVEEIREQRRSDIAVMPAYAHALLARRLEAAGDILRTYPDHAAGRPRWSDRICYELRVGACRRLSEHWPDGGPPWLRAMAMVVALLAHRRVQPAWRLALSKAKEVNTWEPRHEWRSSRIRSTR